MEGGTLPTSPPPSRAPPGAQQRRGLPGASVGTRNQPPGAGNLAEAAPKRPPEVCVGWSGNGGGGPTSPRGFAPGAGSAPLQSAGSTAASCPPLEGPSRTIREEPRRARGREAPGGAGGEGNLGRGLQRWWR